MKQLYCYDGAIWNGNVIFKQVKEYVHASSRKEALELLKRRIKSNHPMIAYIQLKEGNLHEV
jgi:ppGpp synthetase/RelA/SpoT-type nucleotidyltranferase